MITRLEFMSCPCCAGQEMVGAAAAGHLAEAIDKYIKEHPLVDYVETELLNIRNYVINSRESGRATAILYDGPKTDMARPAGKPAESPEGDSYTADPLFD